MRDPQPAFGAKCAIHPDRMATRTCARCGNFTCDECNRQAQETQCPACRTLTGGQAFPFNRTNFTFDALWNYSFEQWKLEWVMLSVCVLIVMAVGMVSVVFNAIFQPIVTAILGDRGPTMIILGAAISSMASQVVSIIAQGAFQMGFVRILIDVLNGRKADVARIMSQLPKLGRYIVQMFLIQAIVLIPLALYFLALLAIAAALMGLSLSGDPGDWERMFRGAGLAVMAGGLVLLVPFLVYVSLPLTFANMELVYGDASPIEAIRRSFQIAKGFRLTIFGFAFIAGLVMLVGFLACCIGILPAWGLAMMLLVALYLALRNGSGLPPPVES